MGNKQVEVPWDLEVILHLLEQEAVPHLDLLHTVLQEEMGLEEEWDLEEHQEAVEVASQQEHSVVEEMDQREDLEVEGVEDLDNKMISNPSDIQVRPKYCDRNNYTKQSQCANLGTQYAHRIWLLF